MHHESTAPANADGLRIAIVASRYHEAVTGPLRAAARETFLAAGGRAEDLFEVPSPGGFELVAICRAVAEHRDLDAIVAVGCVIAGETTHDQHIAQAVRQGLTQIIVETGLPIAFGLLTCPSYDHAVARAGGDHGNKGAEAMTAAIEASRIIADIAHPGGR